VQLAQLHVDCYISMWVFILFRCSCGGCHVIVLKKQATEAYFCLLVMTGKSAYAVYFYEKLVPNHDEGSWVLCS